MIVITRIMRMMTIATRIIFWGGRGDDDNDNDDDEDKDNDGDDGNLTFS